MLKAEEDHINKIGRAEFHRRLVLANMRVREDRRFIGLEKIRNRIAFQAALRATGLEPGKPLKLTDLGSIDGPVQAAADELYVRAIQAAKGR